MLQILSRTTVPIGHGYDFHVLSDQERVWVRLGEASSGKLLRFWSRTAAQTTPEDIAVLVQQVSQTMADAALAALANHTATDVFPKGWEFWPGVPKPIRDELVDPCFKADLRTYREQPATLTGANHRR
jgi:hypothetical protein